MTWSSRAKKVRVAPVVGEKVAVYIIGQYLYAYSSEVGRWDVLKLERPVIPLQLASRWHTPLTIENNVAAVSQGGHLHVFPAKTGRWQTIESKD